MCKNCAIFPGTLEWSVPYGRVWVGKGVALWMVKNSRLQVITGIAKAETYILQRPLKTEFNGQDHWNNTHESKW